jgi:hypothetical protein
MANDTTILNGDIGVYYLSNNRTKMLYWIGGTNDNYTMNQIYSAMGNLLDEETTIDDGSAFSAETPVEYTVGIIDAGDNDPWYITFDLMEHVTGGALRTSGWARVQDSNTGIVMVEVASASSDIDNTNRGVNITHTDGDTGTLLEVISDGGASDYLFIRPDSDAIGNSFDNTTGTLTCSAQTATSITTAAITGDMIWANIYSIGTIEGSVHLYVYQGARGTTDDSNRVYSVNSTTQDYWGQGHIDFVVPINDWKTTAFPAIDGGYLRVFARKGGDLYSSFEVANSTTSGGRNPVPLQTAVDLDQGHGTKKISFTGAVSGGPFTDGEIIRQTTGTNVGAQGILDLSNSTVTSGGELVYFSIAENDIGGLLLAFESGETIQGQTSSASVTTDGAPAVDGPADSTWYTNSGTPPDLVIGNATADIDNDGTDEYYGVTVDCNQNPLSEVYQWAKWICQYTQGDGDMVEQAFTDDLSQINIYGEEYEGGTAYFGYSAISGTIAEGEAVTQATTGATGVIISHDTTNDIVLLRSTRGTFNNSNQIDADDDADYFTPDEAGNFAAKVAAPLGTFAGGTFFGARGILLSDYLAADENSFILTDIPGATRERPTTIVIEVTNLEGTSEATATDDLVGVYTLTGSGGDIDKDEMAADGGEAVGDTTIAVDAIPTAVPSAGRIVLVDNSDGNKEYVLRYSSYDSGTDVFTLANIDLPTITGATTTTLTETAAFTNAKRGDLVLNKSQGDAVSYIKTVDSNDSVTIDPAITGQGNGDNVEINAVPIITTSSDKVFAVIIHRFAANTEESVSIIYPGSTVYFRVKVRNTRSSVKKIKPYSSDGSTSGTDQSIPVVRTEDTIIS